MSSSCIFDLTLSQCGKGLLYCLTYVLNYLHLYSMHIGQNCYWKVHKCNLWDRMAEGQSADMWDAACSLLCRWVLLL